jgi:hypothetical protein
MLGPSFQRHQSSKSSHTTALLKDSVPDYENCRFGIIERCFAQDRV